MPSIPAQPASWDGLAYSPAAPPLPVLLLPLSLCLFLTSLHFPSFLSRSFPFHHPPTPWWFLLVVGALTPSWKMCFWDPTGGRSLGRGDAHHRSATVSLNFFRLSSSDKHHVPFTFPSFFHQIYPVYSVLLRGSLLTPRVRLVQI